MANVIIYSKNNCPYCDTAKQIFDHKNIPYKEILVDQDPQQLRIMLERTGRRTVPQIFINDQHIGGCDDLIALMDAGKLDALLLEKK